MSPLYHVIAVDAAALIMLGDADELVPLHQSEVIIEKFKEAGVPAELVVKKGAKHGIWPSMLVQDFGAFADWFDKYLVEKDAKPEQAKAAEQAAK
jgi:dipeptidyl aminopeptidase/acylaminoacyl peptidase